MGLTGVNLTHSTSTLHRGTPFPCSFRISLTYDTPAGTGKTTTHTERFRGRFVKLVPNEQVVEEPRTVRYGKQFISVAGTIANYRERVSQYRNPY